MLDLEAHIFDLPQIQILPLDPEIPTYSGLFTYNIKLLDKNIANKV
jgi:hypothetical protein